MTPGASQPFLDQLTVVLAAPSQVWSTPDGQISGGPAEITGFFHADIRALDRAVLLVNGAAPEPAGQSSGPASAMFTSVVRSTGLDDGTPDPVVLLQRRRSLGSGTLSETIRISTSLAGSRTLRLRLELATDLARMDALRSRGSQGWVPASGVTGVSGLHDADHAPLLTWGSSADVAVVVGSGTAAADLSDPLQPALIWDVAISRDAPVELSWCCICTVAREAVLAFDHRSAPGALESLALGYPDPRLARLLRQSQDDLDSLRIRLAGVRGPEAFAAGAPWYLTLFGRDSLWAARFVHREDPGVALGTLQALAHLQGQDTDPFSEEEPGKVLHEYRRDPVNLPELGIALSATYYGSVDATPLWVNLLVDLWQAETVERESLRLLIPATRAALDWILHSMGDGFLSYVDDTGHGLSNQGWKDSSDGVQFRDGSLAQAPIALSEVQGYAFEALSMGAHFLASFGEPGWPKYSEAAVALAERFRKQFWCRDELGLFPAIALDADGVPVDSVTSNMGHLLGTGLLNGQEEALVAERLLAPGLNSGFGVRTLSKESAGYWPLKYHGGSVWAHDTAISISGLLKAGFTREAATLASNLLDAAESFQYRMPELFSGAGRDETSHPLPYPAACRPQAWSAAAGVVIAQALNPRV